MHSTLPMFSPFSNDKKTLYAVLEYAKLLHEEEVENMKLTQKYVRLLYFDHNEIKRS